MSDHETQLPQLAARIESVFDDAIDGPAGSKTDAGTPYISMGLASTDRDLIEPMLDQIFLAVAYGDVRSLKPECERCDALKSPKGKRLIWRVRPELSHGDGIKAPFTDPITGRTVTEDQTERWVVYCRFAIEDAA
jgi:hypothetical protein